MSWVHIEDEVGIILWAIDNERVSGVINSTAPNPVTNKELSKAIGRAIDRPAVMPVPGLVLDLKFGSEFGHVLRGGQRVLPRRALDLGYSFRFTEIDEALADLL
jgi:NAD dependent epimerase/dehydratase family enzyme